MSSKPSHALTVPELAEALAAFVSATNRKAAATAYTLIGTAKLNGVDPQAWLAETLACLSDHTITRIDELLPWR